MNIAKSIRVGLAARELAVSDVKNCVKKSTQTVSYWMNNRSTPTASDIEKLAEMFGVKTSEFIAWGE